MRKKALFSALLMLILPMISSCSFITVNFDNIFPYEGTFAETVTDSKADETTKDKNGHETQRPDVDEYQYTGLDEAKKALESVRVRDFEGLTLFINTTATDGVHILTSDFDDSSQIDENDYSAAVYERNKMVEEKLHCDIRYRQTTLDEMLVGLKAAVKDEAYYSDLICVAASELGFLVNEGYLYNLKSIPFFDSGEAYFNRSGVKALSAGYGEYGIISTATVDPDDIYGVYVNLEKLSGVSEADVEALAESGEWTWDRVIEIAKASSFSYSGSVTLLADAVAASLGTEYVSNPKNETPTVILPEKAHQALGIVQTLMNESGSLHVSEGTLSESFLTGESVLHIDKLGAMESLVSASFDWTVLPMPKYSTDQEGYLSYMPTSNLTYAVPVTTTDPEGAGILINAISAASIGMLRDTYVKYHMYNTVRVSSTLDMIELIWDTPYFDFSHALGMVDEDITSATFMALREVAADSTLSLEKLFDKREKAANKALEKYYEPKW